METWQLIGYETALRAIRLLKKAKKKRRVIRKQFCAKCEKNWPLYRRWNYCPYCGMKLETKVIQKQEKSPEEKILSYRYGEEGIERIIESLVKSGESFDGWYERYASFCNGARIRPDWKDYSFRYYQRGGMRCDNYLVPYLLITEDERIKGTALWDTFQALKVKFFKE